MKKTTILRLIALVMCIPFAFSLISCGETEKQTTATTATTSPAVAPPDGIVSASIRCEKIHFNIGKADYMDIEDYAEFEEAIAYVNSDAVKDEYLTVRVTIAEGLDTEKEFSKLSEDILGSDVEMIENTSCADIKVSKYDNDILVLLIWLSDCESVADITVSLPAAE